jgi:hypothetical protein
MLPPAVTEFLVFLSLQRSRSTVVEPSVSVP